MKIVSACLAGIPCRYDGTAKPCQQIIQLIKNKEAIPVCPEELGGLKTPRPPVEIQKDGTVKTKDGVDVTKQFLLGAESVLALTKKYNCQEAIFKSKSPSCGCGKIYDGSFSGTLIDGDGVCTRLLKEHNIKVITEDDL